MKGYPLDMLRHDLTQVPADLTKNPAATLAVDELLGARVVAKVLNYQEFDLGAMLRLLSARVFLKRLTFDQFCKVYYSRSAIMHNSVERLFDDEPEFAIVAKIMSSMWQWGCADGVWNNVVDAYTAIRNFKIPFEGFELRLDFTTGYNKRGYGRGSWTYLDGVFGFLVYHNGQHVMTLGFSIMGNRRVLVHQLQLAQRKGNRFLFKLPANRVEFLLQCFVTAFPGHDICIADGDDVCDVNLRSYKTGLEHVLERISTEPTAETIKRKEDLEVKIAHLTADAPRLAAMYANTGIFARVEEFTANQVRHYRLAAQRAPEGV